MNITELKIEHVTISNIRSKSTARRRLASATGVEFDVAINVDALTSSNTLSSTEALEKATQVKTKVATFTKKLQDDKSFVTSFKADLKTEFNTQNVTFTEAQFDAFDIASVTTAPTIMNGATMTTAAPGEKKEKDKKVLYIGIGAGLGGLVLLGILFAVCRQRKTLEKIDPNMQQDGVVAGQVVPGAGQPMLGQEV